MTRHMIPASMVWTLKPSDAVAFNYTSTGGLDSIEAPVAVAFTRDEIKALAAYLTEEGYPMRDGSMTAVEGACDAILAAADTIEREGGK